MSRDRLPRIFGLFGLLLTSLVVATVSPTAQAPARTAGEVTFTKDIAPILQRSCQDCHRPDSVAPMSLLTYEEVRPVAADVRNTAAARRDRDVTANGTHSDSGISRRCDHEARHSARRSTR